MFIPTDILKAAMLFINTRDTRLALAGARVEIADGAVTVVATDGHRLFAARVEGAEPADLESLTIPADCLKAALAAGGKLPALELIAYTSGSFSIGPIMFQSLPSEFPAWRAVMPCTITGEAAQFNPAYVGDLGKVSKALGDKTATITIHHNGDSAAIVTFGTRSDCFALLMPCRAKLGPASAAGIVGDVTGSAPVFSPPLSAADQRSAA